MLAEGRWPIRGLRSTAVLALLVVGFVFTMPSSQLAHDIPADILVRLLVKPEGDRIRVLVRAPLSAMQDIVFPQRGPGYLDIPRADASLRQGVVVWIADDLEVYEDGERLESQELVAVRASIPSDRSFANYDQALAHVLGPRLPDHTEIVWQQAMIDALFEYRIHSDQSEFAIESTLARLGLRTRTVLRFVLPDGSERPFDYRGNPGLVRLDPRWHQAALRFVYLGFEHILDGIDHLLFLACLVIPFRRVRSLIAIITSFTIAHSVTLIASVFDFAPDELWFPPLVEMLIALSIVYMALENIIGTRLRKRWLLAFGFGLVHGFGFSFALSETLQFAGGHLFTSLLSFNVGVELGQLLVILAFVPGLALLFRFVVAERVGAIILSALIAHTAWHWMIDRGGELLQFQFRLPVFDSTLLASAMQWGMLMLVLTLLVWLMSTVFPRLEDVGADATAAKD